MAIQDDVLDLIRAFAESEGVPIPPGTTEAEIDALASESD
jgi:hypothetical protein